MEKYILNLKKYANSDFFYILENDSITIYIDNEVRYEYDTNKKKIYRRERGSCIEIQRYGENRFLRLQFAFIIRGAFSEGYSLEDMEKFAEKNNMEEIKEVAKEFFDDRYYSIGTVEEKKVSLIYEEKYKLIFRYKNKDYIIEDDLDKKIVFNEFYYKVFYWSSLETKIKRYIDIFGERFTEDEIITFWGYPIGIR